MAPTPKYLFVGGPHDGEQRELAQAPSILTVNLEPYELVSVSTKDGIVEFYRHTSFGDGDAVRLLIANYRPLFLSKE